MDYGLLGFMAKTRILFTDKGEELAAIGLGATHNTIRNASEHGWKEKLRIG